jgi:hypothetical protein
MGDQYLSEALEAGRLQEDRQGGRKGQAEYFRTVIFMGNQYLSAVLVKPWKLDACKRTGRGGRKGQA